VSVVTSLLLSCSCNDYDGRDERPDLRCAAIRHVKAWCDGDHKGPDERSIDQIRFPDKDVDAVSAGTKHMQCHVYAWGANYLDLEGFLEAVRTAPWWRPGCVQVFARGEDDERFTVFNLGEDRQWEKPCPGPT
jgi:hypothetical protein